MLFSSGQGGTTDGMMDTQQLPQVVAIAVQALVLVVLGAPGRGNMIKFTWKTTIREMLSGQETLTTHCV